MSVATPVRITGNAVTVRKQRRSAAWPYLFVLPAVVFLAGLLIYPLVLNIVLSFQDTTVSSLIRGNAPWVGVANYRAALTDPAFVQAAWHSVVFSIVSVAIQLGLGLGLALFYSGRFIGAVTMRSLYLIGYAIPIVVTAQVFRWLLDGQSGLVNSALSALHLQSQPVYWLSDPSLALPVLIVVQVWLGVPFTMVNLLAGVTTVPPELYEASTIDGAGAWRRFTSVTWPWLRPTFAATTTLSLIFTFKTFDLVWIATQGGPAGASEILPTLAYRSVFTEFLFGKGAAILNLVFAVLFVLAVGYLWSLRREERRR
jgi:multiple sugar transport system permease protein